MRWDPQVGQICLDGVDLEWPAEVCSEQHNSVFVPREGGVQVERPG